MPELDPIIQPLARTKIMATLHAVGAVPKHNEMKFARLRELLDVSDATLSKNLGELEKAGYISRFREYGSTRAKDTVWVSLTEAGARSYQEHVAALKKLLAEGC
ncbi:transcriptional regulator [Corynebacterium sp. H128]|uniref:transcriptional regulator n=1 Tax=unclassified Corynebacterium TaxID=2624378 RepID=UPI0030A5C19C